jgi:hypothetical protein
VRPTPGIPVFASENWLTEFGGSPGGREWVEGILVRAEALNPNSHGFVLRAYHSTWRNLVAQQCGGDGFRPSPANQAGTLWGATMVENYYENLFADQNRGWGFNQAATNGTQLTDAHMMNVVARGLSQVGNPEAAESIGGMSIPFAAGRQNRFRTDGVVIGNCWGGSILDGAHIEQGYENAGLRLPKLAKNQRTLSKIRDSASGRTLAVEDMPLAIGGAASWGGAGAKATTLPLPKMTLSSARQFMLSIGSSINYTSTRRATYVGAVMIGIAAGGAAQAYLVAVVPPTGFDVVPTVAVTTSPTPTTAGVLTVTFTPTNVDGYGSVGLTGGQS